MPPSTAEACPLCGHSRFEVLFQREFRVVVCRHCSLVFQPDSGRDHKRYYAEEYEYRLGADGGFSENVRDDESVSKWVLKHLPQAGEVRLLEVGCGAGYLLKRLQGEGIDVHGIEPNQRAVAFARDGLQLENVQCCVLKDAGLPERRFDAVLLIQTLEHLADPLDSLRQVRQFLKRDGLLFVEVPNYFSPDGFYLHKVDGLDYPSPNHLFVYSRRTLAAFLTRAGFSVHKTSYTLRNLRMVAAMGEPEPVRFGGYVAVQVFYRLLPLMRWAIDAYRWLKVRLGLS